jgi:hypothetical protein
MLLFYILCCWSDGHCTLAGDSILTQRVWLKEAQHDNSCWDERFAADEAVANMA